QPQPGHPLRHLHQVEEEAGAEEVAQRCPLGRVLLEHETEAQTAGGAQGEHQYRNRHAAYLNDHAGSRTVKPTLIATGPRRLRPRTPGTVAFVTPSAPPGAPGRYKYRPCKGS